MKKYIVLGLLLLIFNLNGYAQKEQKENYFQIIFSPNLCLGNRTFTTQNNAPTFLKNSNTVGLNMGFGYVYMLKKKAYLEVNGMFQYIRNGVDVDYEKSGYNTYTTNKLTTGNYPFDYYGGLGLNVSAFWRIKNFKKSFLSAGIGAHVSYSLFTHDANYVQSYLSTSAGIANIYAEYINDYPKVMPGGDLYLRYNLRKILFGVHYCYNANDFSGDFKSFEGFAMENQGTFKIKSSSFGVTFGLKLGGPAKSTTHRLPRRTRR